MPADPQRRRAAALALTLTAVLALVGYHLLIDTTRTWDYNAVRLMRTFVLLSEERLYPPVDAGPILNSIYGPVGAAAYLPAALLGSPAPAVLAGQALSLLFFFLPVLALHLRPRPGLQGVFGFLAFAALAIDLRPLEYVAFTVHVDAPALALAILALAAVVGAKPSSEARRFSLAAALAALAVWTKLMLLPLLAALPAWVLLTRGARPALRLAARLAVALAAISAAMVLLFGPAESVIFNMWTLPARQTLGQIDAAAVARAAFRLLWEGSLAWLLWLGAVAWRLGRRRAGWRGDPAVSYGFLGLCLAPLSVLGFLKPGGDVNAFSYTVYFLAAGATLSLAAAARREPVARRLLMAVPTFVLAVVVAVQEPGCLGTWREPPALSELPHQRAFDYAREHPGELYFPRITLATFLAEGEVYHQSVGLLDRAVAGIPPGAAHLRAHLPAELAGVALYENAFVGDFELLGLPEFCRPTDLPELPGFVVFRREDEGRCRARSAPRRKS